MKNKRKIWVRLGAFMAALICCVLCVVPAYAEAAEAETETAQEQEEKLNAMVGSDVFRAVDHVVDLNYRNMHSYAVLDSNSFYVNTWYAITGVPVVAQNLAGYLYVKIYDQDGNMVDEYGQVVRRISMNYPAGTSGFLRFVDTVTGAEAEIGTGRSSSTNKVTFRFVEVRNGANIYYSSSGYTYEGYCVLDNVTPDNGMFYCFSDQLYNPSKMLSYSFAGDVDEVYNNGYNTGYNEGYTFGYTTGKTEGEEYGYRYGHEEGFGLGLDQGYRTGYDDGMHQTSLIEGIKSLFRAPMEFIESVLDFEIFGIDLGDAVKALVSMMLLALVITVVWKAVK